MNINGWEDVKIAYIWCVAIYYDSYHVHMLYTRKDDK
jgi:hypothetical protein